MNAKKLRKVALMGLGCLAGTVILLAVFVFGIVVAIVVGNDGLIPVDVRWLVAYAPDFEMDGVSIQGQTEDSVVVEWHSLYFEILDTPKSPDLVLEVEVVTETSIGTGWQYYPIATSNVSTQAGYSHLGGDIPSACFGIKGHLSFYKEIGIFFLHYRLGAWNDTPTVCYWKIDRQYHDFQADYELP